MALVVLVAACASPRSYSTAEKEAWIMDQQDRFNALSIAYVRGPDWRDLYEVTAAKVWSYGHQGAEFPRDYAWPERSRVLAPPLVSSGWHDATNTVGYHRRLGPHSGIDIPAPVGAPVYSVHAGTVRRSENSPRLGHNIKIQAGRGLLAQYMHLDDRLVEVGEVVHKGQLIGYSGMSGTLTGLVPHLHLALWLGGGSVNPQPELGRSLAWPL